MHNGGRTALFEHLGQRVVLSVTASFSPNAGVLSVFGDSPNNNIVVSLNAAGNIFIIGGSTAVADGTPSVVNGRLYHVFGQGGNDILSLNEADGALSAENLISLVATATTS
jgi:hypothetical protein